MNVDEELDIKQQIETEELEFVDSKEEKIFEKKPGKGHTHKGYPKADYNLYPASTVYARVI